MGHHTKMKWPVMLLAGGQSRRMGGGDKGLRLIKGRSLIDHVIDRVQDQATQIALNANGDPARFSDYRLPVFADSVSDFPGPLAGVLAAMEWACTLEDRPQFVVTVPTDAPFIPDNLVHGLYEGMVKANADMACAMSDGRHHPVVGIWPVKLAKHLRLSIVEEQIRRVDRWTALFHHVAVPFALSDIDPFFNANYPEDLQRAEEYMRNQPL